MTTAVNTMLGHSNDYIVDNAETHQDAANNFVKFVYRQLLQVVSEELLEVYDDKIIEIDSEFTKEENLRQTNKAF